MRSPIPISHLYQGAGALQHHLHKSAHLPTGRIALEDVVRCVITQLGVIPLRPDWEAILAETQAAFQQWRTWGRIASRLAWLWGTRAAAAVSSGGRLGSMRKPPFPQVVRYFYLRHRLLGWPTSY